MFGFFSVDSLIVLNENHGEGVVFALQLTLKLTLLVK